METPDEPFGPQEETQPDDEGTYANLAFVLLSERRLPDAQEVAQAFRRFASPAESCELQVGEVEQAARSEILSLDLSTGESSFVALMPMPVPEREAEDAAQFSLSSFRPDWELAPHCAHVAVIFRGPAGPSPVVQLSRFTSLLAAVTKCSPSVGVYWGNAGATHEAEFFVSLAADADVVPRIVLWSGVSVAREKDGRLSLLSLGMQQLDLPDLLLIAGESSQDVAVETLYDMLAYIARRGEAIPEGHTVGRSEEERLPVRYVPSPIDPDKEVWCVELP